MNKFRWLSLLGICFSMLTITTAFSQMQKRYPCGWYFELEPFVVKVNNNLSEFSIARVATDDLCHDRFVNLKNKKVLGVYAAVGYDFASCSDYYWGASLAYTYFDKNDHRSHHLKEHEDHFATSFGFLPGSDFSDLHGKLDTTYNQVDLLAHFHYCVCRYTQLDVFGGARYVNIEEELNVNFDVTSDPQDPLHKISHLGLRIKDEFQGVGPELGLGLFAPFNCYLGITGQVAGSYLYTDHDQNLHSQFTDILPSFTTTFDNSFFESHNDHNWVPAASANAGLSYQVLLCNCHCLKAELGYRYDGYYNLRRENFVHCDCDRGKGKHNRFDFQGPYLKLSWHF